MIYRKYPLAAVYICFLCASAYGSGIPIWEFLRYEEKLGRLIYIFVQLVENCCSSFELTECRKAAIMQGVCNLLNKTEAKLDLLDPYQHQGHLVIWEAATKSEPGCQALTKNGSQILLEALHSLKELDDYK